MERGLEAVCGGAVAMVGALPSGMVCCRGLLLLGALNGVEDVVTTGGRGRLGMDRLCCDAC